MTPTASLIIARCRELFSAIQNEPWFKLVCMLYIGVSEDVTVRWRNERDQQFTKRGLTIVRCFIPIAAASNTSYGATCQSTLEGLIAEAARTQLPGARHLNIPKKFGAGVDKVDDAVQAVTSWEDGGRDEHFTFASDTGQIFSSDGRGSGTRALASALIWGDAGAKHAYVVFLSEVNGRADSDDDFQDVGGGGGCGTRSSGRGGGGGGRGGMRQLLESNSQLTIDDSTWKLKFFIFCEIVTNCYFGRYT